MKKLSEMLVASCLLFGAVLPTPVYADEWEAHLARQFENSARKMLNNVSPEFGAVGSVVASRSYRPDYRFHWIRDAALVMDTVVGLWEVSADRALEKTIWDYVALSRRNQLTANRSGEAGGAGLGEPKFEIDGAAFAGDWGRPQNDGPALRAATLLHFADLLIGRGRKVEVRQLILPVLRADLEYCAAHWRDPSFDPWEEVLGNHFYVSMVQRRALVEGAWMLERLGDAASADALERQVPELEHQIRRHWSSKLGYFVATLDRSGGADYKYSGLDVATLLAVLHGRVRLGPARSLYTPLDSESLANALALERAFGSLYRINSRDRDVAGAPLTPAIGRYPEDKYDGYDSEKLGNGWFLATHALAEFYYLAARQATPRTQSGSRGQAGDLRERGDAFMRRSRFHMNASGNLSEQMNRDNGYMQGAEDLTWSHASFLTAVWAR